MIHSPENKKKIEKIADEAIMTISTIAAEAEKQLAERQQPPNTNVFVSAQTGFSGQNSPIDNLKRIRQEVSQNLKALAREPAIARIVALNEDGIAQTYYICRSAPISISESNLKLSSYKAPIGRLASIPVGDEVDLQIGGQNRTFEVVSRTNLHPMFDAGWDSLNNAIEDSDFIVTIPSFRKIIADGRSKEVTQDLLMSLLEDEESGGIIIDGLRRSVIDRIQLRDQPILDQYQDEIFRLPIDRQLLIQGPPGTGKTTTLIRRLGQKLDISFLLEDEQEQVRYTLSTETALPHDQSWIMFTPTELLKLYIKEAFNREGIPAPDKRIQTWNELRRHLSREVLRILKSGTGGSLTLREDASILLPSAITESNEWYEDFRSYFLSDIQVNLKKLVEWLGNAKDSRVIAVAAKATKILFSVNSSEIQRVNINKIKELTTLEEEINRLLQSYGDILDNSIKEWINTILGTDEAFLDKLAAFIDSLELSTTKIEETEDEDEDEDEEGVLSIQTSRNIKTSRKDAFREYSLAMKRWARIKYRGKTLNPLSKTARIVEWMGERTPAIEDLREAGLKLETQSKLRKLSNPSKLYFDQIPKGYLQFRKIRIKENNWYDDNSLIENMIRNREVNGLELDIIILTMLRHSSEIIKIIPADVMEKKSKYSKIIELQFEYRNQVMVDEATDFSPVQLACMMELSHPKMRSFFACGDLLQRVTHHGIRSMKQVEWVSKDIEVRPVNIAYRQSKMLIQLARSIAALGGESLDSIITPKAYIDNEGEKPVLAENIEGNDLAVWLGDRVCEVERRIGKLPSIAIFVDEEPEVEPLAKKLSETLQSHNIAVASCPQGKVIGHDGAVRIFDVQHIKGLEFEAVFFVGADKLAMREPDIFNKFLYVGATRAATYFGLTCVGTLPVVMESIRDQFVYAWGND
jgi:GTPase SAR1 family protein